MHLAEIIRLRGRLWQATGRRSQARLCFERAVTEAHAQDARLFELNAARDLARLGIAAGGGSMEREHLRTIVDWFPASLDVPVLAECRALLG